jgi:hypothetical protein
MAVDVAAAGGSAVTPDVRTLAVWLRQAEWLCADAAHSLPVGDYPAEEQATLADALEKLAHAVRRHAGLPAPADQPPAGQDRAHDAAISENTVSDRD